MTTIDDLLGGLFPDKPSKIIYKENISQTDKEIEAITAWMESTTGKEIFDLVYKNYHLKKAGVNKKPEVHLLTSPYANGFAISFDKPFTEDYFNNLFFAFGQRILEMGYEKVSLDRKLQEVNDMVKTTEKLYFKPPISAEDLKKQIDQKFGNVSIEKTSFDKKANFLKVLVTIYSDRFYLKARPFDQFMENLFKC